MRKQKKVEELLKNLNPFEFNETLKLRPELLGLTSIVPTCEHDSSPRSVMFLKHIAQSLVLDNPEEPILQSGSDYNILKYNFKKMLDTDAEVLAIVPRYRSLDNTIDSRHLLEYVIFYYDINRERYSLIRIPKYEMHTKWFGFEHTFTDKLKSLEPGDFIEEDEYLTKTNNDKDNGIAYGTILNALLTHSKEAGEDACWISRTASEKLSFSMYDKIVVEIGRDKIPLNYHGNKDNYKFMLDIGDVVGPDRIICAVRDLKQNYMSMNINRKDINMLSIHLLDKNSLRKSDPIFDRIYRASREGGVVRDIRVIHAIGSDAGDIEGLDDQIMKYVNMEQRFAKELVDVYNNVIPKEGKKSPMLVREIADAMSVIDPDIKKFLYKKEQLPTYRIEITIEYKVKPHDGFKISGIHGDKSVIAFVRDDEDMPEGVDIVMEATPSVSRLNYGRLFDMYYNATSRNVQKIVRDIIGKNGVDNASDKKVLEAFNVMKDLANIFENEWTEAYNNASDINLIREEVKTVYEKEVFIHRKPSDKKRNIQIVKEISEKPYAPKRRKIKYKDRYGNIKETKKPALVAPMYIMLLNKIANSTMAISTPKVNHFGIPINANSNERVYQPFKFSATKTVGETEGRMYLAVTDREAMAELRDRATSTLTHREEYRQKLTAEYPTNIDCAVDRDIFPYGKGKVDEIMKTTLNAFGIDFGHSVMDYELINEEEEKNGNS